MLSPDERLRNLAKTLHDIISDDKPELYIGQLMSVSNEILAEANDRAEALRKANEALTTHHAFIEHLRDNGYSAADGELCEKFLRKHPTPTGDLGKANATDSCVVEPYSSRMCERGTKACSVRHTAQRSK